MVHLRPLPLVLVRLTISRLIASCICCSCSIVAVRGSKHVVQLQDGGGAGGIGGGGGAQQSAG